MQFVTAFVPPSELEMFERGFGLSRAHDPDEAIFSFVRDYDNSLELTITFEIGSVSSVFVSIACGESTIGSLSIEGIRDLSFQSWHGEPVMRIVVAH